VQSIREGGDTGLPAMLGTEEIAKKAFVELAGHTVRSIAMKNANMDVEKIAQVVA
jgi:ATP-binding protein involved in chromosome partitioning